jgi:pimeloyl-ACP methyl ester carboxylesterase
MSTTPTVVLAHGAWADGSSWAPTISLLHGHGISMLAAPLPLTSLADDVAALGRTMERIEGPIVLVAHAYAGAVISAVSTTRVSARLPTCSTATTGTPTHLSWNPTDTG